MSLIGVIGAVTETGRGGDAFSFEWRIPYFSSQSHTGGDFFQNPPFAAFDGLWYFRLYPNGISRNPPSEWVSLFLIRMDAGPPKTLIVRVGIGGPQGAENKKQRLQKFSSEDDSCCWRRFCKISKLSERKAMIPKSTQRVQQSSNDSELVITLDMKSVVPSVAKGVSSCKDASSQTESELRDPNAPTGKTHSLDMQGIRKLSEDIGKLLVSRDDGDVTVKVGDVQFKAHKLILSVRSPVLSAMLMHEAAERASNTLYIRDCEPNIFKDFLQYLYKGTVQSLTEKNVFGLYRVADRYLTDDLKLQCLRHVIDSLSVPTLCEALRLALAYGESGLLQKAVDFAKENFQSVSSSAEWKNFVRECPKESNEILIKCFGAPS